MSKKPVGELLDGYKVVQYLRPNGDFLSVVSPVLATYCHDIYGDVTITVQLGRTHGVSVWRNAAKMLGRQTLPFRPVKELGRLELTGDSIRNNEAVDINLEPHTRDARSCYILTIEARNATAAHAATAWIADDAERVPGHMACYFNGQDQGDYGLTANLFFANPRAESAVPPAVLYSPVTQCNLNCIHCISRHTRNKLSKLSPLFKEHFKELCQNGAITFIATDYSGDILWADHRFGGELDYVFSLGIPFHIDTNGAYLLRETVDRVIDRQLHSINISLDAATDENFRRVRKGAPPLQEVLENIRYLVNARKRAGKDFPITVSFTLMSSTLHEWHDFIRMAVSVGVYDINARHLEAYTADMEGDSLWHEQARYNTMRESAMALAESLGVRMGAPPPFSGLPTRQGHLACPEPWRSAVILGNGDVSACCVPGMVMGNLNEQSLEEIWNGSRYQALRASVNTKNAPIPCQSCPMYRLADNPDSYLIYSARQHAVKASIASGTP